VLVPGGRLEREASAPAARGRDSARQEPIARRTIDPLLHRAEIIARAVARRVVRDAHRVVGSARTCFRARGNRSSTALGACRTLIGHRAPLVELHRAGDGTLATSG
jgi:hypothetical protein